MGNSGLTVPRLAIGTGSHGWQRASDQTRLGEDAFVRLMRHGFDHGVTFLDLADLYGSHAFARSANGMADAITVGHITEVQFDNTIVNIEQVLARNALMTLKRILMVTDDAGESCEILYAQPYCPSCPCITGCAQYRYDRHLLIVNPA